MTCTRIFISEQMRVVTLHYYHIGILLFIYNGLKVKLLFSFFVYH